MIPRDAAPQIASRVRKLDARIDPHAFVGVIDFNRFDPQSALDGVAYDVGDIEFTLSIIRREGRESVAKQIGAKQVDAGVALF